CKKCNTVFNVLANRGACPKCGEKAFEELSGTEFNIKEIVAC
ncbi:MAG: hydrogenase maturation nickel metallochaperone HypA, partial [Clostridiales bacterium]|nr:hydrogenase maturation nickel metallochaperone HypA [Clostridiales bacterium]